MDYNMKDYLIWEKMIRHYFVVTKKELNPGETVDGMKKVKFLWFNGLRIEFRKSNQSRYKVYDADILWKEAKALAVSEVNELAKKCEQVKILVPLLFDGITAFYSDKNYLMTLTEEEVDQLLEIGMQDINTLKEITDDANNIALSLKMKTDNGDVHRYIEVIEKVDKLLLKILTMMNKYNVEIPKIDENIEKQKTIN